MIPNSTIMDSIMTNYYSDSEIITIMVPCGVSYDSDFDRVEDVTLEVATEVRDELEEAVDDFDPVLRYTAFGESNIDFRVVMQARDRPGTFMVRHELIKRLNRRFRSEGIGINYPVRKLVTPLAERLDGPVSDSIPHADGTDNLMRS